jgi:hypothetical protein
MRLAWLFVALTLGCSPAAPPTYTLPATARLTLHGVTVGLGKFDGHEWDGPGQVAPGQVRRLALVLSAPNPYAQVAAILADPVNQSLSKPEVLGRAMLLTSRGFGPPTKLDAQRDTFTPLFTGPPTWSGVPFDGSTRLSVELSDDDVMFSDPIGSFQINNADMAAALHEGRVVQVQVDDQTNSQVLFAAISVMPE